MNGFGVMDSYWLFLIAMGVFFGGVSNSALRDCARHLGRIADALEKRP